jgi:hypothetical protein
VSSEESGDSVLVKWEYKTLPDLEQMVKIRCVVQRREFISEITERAFNPSGGEIAKSFPFKKALSVLGWKDSLTHLNQDCSKAMIGGIAPGAGPRTAELFSLLIFLGDGF